MFFQPFYKVQRALRARTDGCLQRLSGQPLPFYGVVAARYPQVSACYLKLGNVVLEAYGDTDYQDTVLSLIRPERYQGLPALTFADQPLTEVWLEPFQVEDGTQGIHLVDAHERIWWRATWRGVEDLTQHPELLAS